MNIEELKAKALDFIRCGIAANYSGDRRGELMLQVYDPAAAIFEELEAVKAERDALKDELGGWESTLRSLVADKYNENETALDAVGNYVSDLNHDLDSLRARIEAAKKQAPVGYFYLLDFSDTTIYKDKEGDENYAPLYASPVPAQKGTPAYSCVYCGCLELEKVTACHCLPQGAEQKWNEHMVFPALD